MDGFCAGHPGSGASAATQQWRKRFTSWVDERHFDPSPLGASRVLASRERQAGQGFRSPACRASEPGLDGRVQRVPWLRVAPRARHVGRVQATRLADRKLPPASCRARLRSEPLPTLSRRRLSRLRKTFAVLKGALASTGHRGRVDARGLRSGRVPGLTRSGGPRCRRSFSRPTNTAPSAPRAWSGAARSHGAIQRTVIDPKRNSAHANSPPRS